ncbi:MAG: putative inorganic carbon transporter subunit DabA [Gammaproteobacteria bacterium]
MPELSKVNTKKERADIQMVFCIDIRSEPFRRTIEKLGNYETLGFAGFFGLPVSIEDYESKKIKDSCPVLLKPRFNIVEKPFGVTDRYIERHKQGKKFKMLIIQVYQELKYNFSTPFALAESLGLWCGISMLLKSLAPRLYRRISTQCNRMISPPIQSEPDFEIDRVSKAKGISLDDQIVYAEMALRLMGLTENFAKLVIFCGHGSSTQNNPYASALDCGACGGNQGGKNAQLLACILNKKIVRDELAKIGINIPSDTLFYGAQHNTTTDEVTIYALNHIERNHSNILEQLKADLKLAKQNNNLQRAIDLTALVNSKGGIQRKSVDWSETRPEWGLARNAAFIVGPRQLTKEINLEGRCFLHSYDWRQDKGGYLLETILTAPMVVAQWINTQYLFSTIDNVSYGSGSKVTHNVTGKFGVMQGNASDLMHGLPLQSVMSHDEKPYHEPQRLLTIVYAPRASVSEIIEKHELLKSLFFNQWVHMTVIEPQSNSFYSLGKDKVWSLMQ